MLAGSGGVDGDLTMQVVGDSEDDHVDGVLAEQPAIVRIIMEQAVLFCKSGGVSFRGRGDRKHLGVGHLFEGVGMNARNELRANEADPNRVAHGFIRVSNPCGIRNAQGYWRRARW